MFRSGRVSGYERKIDFVFLSRRKRDLGFFGLFFDTLNGVGLLGEIDAGVIFELCNDPVHDAVIPVITAEVRVTIRGADFKDPIANFQRRDIKCATTEVINGDFFVFHFIKTVGQRGGSRFIDNSLNVKPRDLACIFCGITLRIVKISGHRNDGFRDFLTQLGFGVRFKLGENHCRDFLRRESLRFTVNLDLNVCVTIGCFDEFVRHAVFFCADFVKFAAHEALNRKNRVGRVCDGLTFSGLTHKTLARFCEGHNGWSCACALGVFQHDRLTGFHHRHAGVCCS